MESEEPKPQGHDKITKMINRLISAREGDHANFLELTEPDCKYVIEQVYPIFENEESMLEIKAPICICGDIHGQFYDLLRIFECLQYPPKTNYLFLGDYVDRGKKSLETILLLFCLKIKYPNNIFLLRGNHESSEVNKMYGFFDECKRRIGVRIYKSFSEVFNMLPITALVEGKILCMHGGLSKELTSLKDLKLIRRPTEIPDKGLLCDLVWSDPSSEIPTNFGPNEREVSVTFSKDVVISFTEKNDLDLICRAHQVVEEGYEFFADMKLVTVFSAPNYMGEFDNNGGVLSVDEDLLCKFHVITPISDRQKVHKEKIRKLVN